MHLDLPCGQNNAFMRKQREYGPPFCVLGRPKITASVPKARVHMGRYVVYVHKNKGYMRPMLVHVGSKKLEKGPWPIDAGVPSCLCLGIGDSHIPTLWLLRYLGEVIDFQRTRCGLGWGRPELRLLLRRRSSERTFGILVQMRYPLSLNILGSSRMRSSGSKTLRFRGLLSSKALEYVIFGPMDVQGIEV